MVGTAVVFCLCDSPLSQAQRVICFGSHILSLSKSSHVDNFRERDSLQFGPNLHIITKKPFLEFKQNSSVIALSFFSYVL